MDCSVLARCVFRNGHWETIALEACDAGQGLYCHANEGKCSANPGKFFIIRKFSKVTEKCLKN